MNIIVTVHRKDYTWPLEMDLPPLVAKAVQRGMQEWLKDAGALPAGSTLEERQAEADKRMERILNGTYAAGSRGRGSSLDEEEQYLHEWLEKNGHKGKKSDLQARLISLAAATLANQGMAKAEAIKIAPAKVDVLIEQIKEDPRYKAIVAANTMSSTLKL